MWMIRRFAVATSVAAMMLVWACSSDDSATAPHPTKDGGGDTQDAAADADAAADGSTIPQKQGDYDLKPNSDLPVTTCTERTLTPPSSGICAVTTTGTGTAKVFQGTVLLPGSTLHNGEVVVDNGVVTCSGCDCSAQTNYATASIIQCANGVISPGLINTHDHITYANNPPIPHGTIRYESRQDWRKGDHGATPIDEKSGANIATIVFAELRFLMGGVTSTAGAGGHIGLVRNLDVTDTAMLQGLPILPADSDTFPLDDTSGAQNKTGCTYGSSRATTNSIKAYDGYLPHIAEGIDLEARNEFVCQDKDDPTNGYYDLVQPQTAIIHGIPLIPSDAADIRKNDSSLIWSPRTNVDLYGNTAPITMLDAQGVMISLGTDWVISGSMNTLRELKCADSLNQKYYDKHFSDSDIWKMATFNAAIATGAKSVLGQLSPGFAADIAIYDGTTDKDHRAVINAGDEDVVLVLRGGVPLYGDTALMSDPVIGAAACEGVNAGSGDVCGKPKLACVAKDLNDGTNTLASVTTVGSAFYPLFFCKTVTPTNEPSCVPYRDTYANGITATDSDGDGIDDTTDDCPNIFNPIRLMDNGIQADADGDGVGDACDRCPLDASNACTKPDANDDDGDGITNDKDNCPKTVNADQADGDSDGYGDACDKCPTANPGETPCVTTVTAIRNPADPNHVKSGVNVTVTGLNVNALLANSGTSRGFYAQIGTDPFSGIAINTGSTPAGVAVGNVVSVTGYYFENHGMSTITAATTTITDSGTTLAFAPIVVAPTDIATGGALEEGYEGMLVEVNNSAGALAVTNDMPDGTSKFYDIVITGNLWIGDQIWVRYGNSTTAAYPPANFVNGTTFTSITGVLGYAFSNAQLWPRKAVDVVSP
jgi:cytosine/adenosine deaminase-related metal-dependent hydrolase